MTDPATHSPPVQRLLDDPIGVYKELKERVEKFGPLAPMPEFETTVRYLQRELQEPEIVAYCKENSFAEAQRQLALNGLWHCDLAFEVSPETGGYHQHEPPAPGRFPCVPTLNVIEDAVAFFDSYERATKHGHDYHYQLDRYRYHGLTLPYLKDWYEMPTQDALSLRDLLVVRAVPVGLTMVAARTNFLDAYFNSPLNAKVHDDNHNRRFRSENQRYFDLNGVTTDEQKLQAFEQFHRTIQDIILPSIDIAPGMDEHEQNVRKAMCVLYFELLHEYAKTPDRGTVLTELMFQPDGPSAFEVVLREGETSADIEKRRLENKNLDSGAIFSRGRANNTVYYFMDKGRNFLTSAFNKITHGFFDNGKDNSPEVPHQAACTPELFAEAAERIMRDFNITAEESGLTRSRIIGLLRNEQDGVPLGKNLETYPGHEAENPLNLAPAIVRDHRESDAHRQGFVLG